jgi:hypothetical protein
MIKGVSGGRYINVIGGSSSMPYISPGAVGAGMIRYNGNIQSLEINDGISWQTVPQNFPIIDLNSEAVEILDWARDKRLEEQRLQSMLEKYPGLRKAKENFDLMLNIVKDDYENS